MSVPVSSAPTASLTPAPPTLRQWVKAHDNWHTNALYRLAKTCTTFSVPLIPGVHRLLYWLHRAIAATWASTTRIV